MAGARGYAAAQFGLASAAFATGGGVVGSSGTVISGRHLSFVSHAGDRPDNAMAITAQLPCLTDLSRRSRAGAPASGGA